MASGEKSFSMDETFLGTILGYVPALMDIFGYIIVTLAWLVTRVFTLQEIPSRKARTVEKSLPNQFYYLANKQSELRNYSLKKYCWTTV